MNAHAADANTQIEELRLKQQEIDELDQRIKESKATIRVVYPDISMLKNRKTIVLVMGQSFDFDGVLSTIKTRCSVDANVQFYKLDISGKEIQVYQELDVDVCRKSGKQDLSQYPLHPIGMTWIKGSLQETLPLLLSHMES